MTSTAAMIDDLREKIIADPDVILEDRDVMRALMAASDSDFGNNIVDLRGIALDRLESRLDRLEDTHRSVIAAAYENLAGTNPINRAILRMLEPTDFASFLRDLGGDVADLLRVEAARLVLETISDDDNQEISQLDNLLVTAEPGFVDSYLTLGRNVPVRQVVLRQVQPDTEMIYGETTDWIRSEACLRLDFGPGRLPGMLVLGAEDPHHFKPTQGTDLLAFFAGVFERVMRRWLA